MTRRSKPTPSVIRREGKSVILQQPGSLMFQVWVDGKFQACYSLVGQAHGLLDKLQGRAR